MMTKRKNKKALKYRGNRTQGYGCHKKHRGGGSKGGRGYGGSKKHKRIGYLKFEPEHYGSPGFTAMKNKQKRVFKTINVEELAVMVKDKKDETKVSSDLSVNRKKKDIDIQKEGVHKLLGKGKIDFAINVIVRQASARAIEKIEAAGGTVTVTKHKDKLKVVEK